jgi:C4-dicarboxylate transporter, DctQ subunit
MTRILERFSIIVENIAGLLLLAITLLIVASAIGRYGFATPIPDAFDIARLLLGATIMWGFASVGYRGSHIQVDVFSELLPPRARRIVDLIAWSVLLLFVALLAWKMLARVESARASHEATFDLRLPVWPLMAATWAGALASLFTVLARLVLIWNGDDAAAAGGDPKGPPHE